MAAPRPRVEVLAFAGCPNAQPAVDLVTRVISELGISADVVRIDVDDAWQAERLRFLGSPSVQLDGIDIEPGARERTNYAFSCRLYRTDTGLSGQPSQNWLRDALEGRA
jgi:hypothetical protein